MEIIRTPEGKFFTIILDILSTIKKHAYQKFMYRVRLNDCFTSRGMVPYKTRSSGGAVGGVRWVRGCGGVR